MADRSAKDSDNDIPELEREGDKPTRQADKSKSRSTKNSKTAEKTAVSKGANIETEEDRTRGKQDESAGLSPAMQAMLLQMHQNNQQMMQQMMTGLTGVVGDIKKAVEKNGPAGAQDTIDKRKTTAKPIHDISEEEESEEEEEEEEPDDKPQDQDKKEEEPPREKRDDEETEEGELGATGDAADELIMQIGSRFAKKEKQGKKINEKVARLVTSGLEAKPVPDKIKEVAERCLPPENVPDLIAAEPSEEIKGIIAGEHSRRRERNFLTIHQDIIAGMQIMAQGMSTAYVAMKEGKKLEAEGVFRQMSDTFTMLADAHWNVTMRRRENIRPYMLQQYKQLCDEESEVPPSKYLFGRRVAKRMEAIDKVKKVQAKITAVEDWAKKDSYKDHKEERKEPKRSYKEWSNSSHFQGRFNKKPRN